MKGKIKGNVLTIGLYSLAIGPIIIGGNLFLYLIDKLPYGLDKSSLSDYIYVNVGMLGGLLISWFIVRWSKKRRGKIPPLDERTINNMKNYFVWVLFLSFICSGLFIIILSFVGVPSVEVGMIALYLSNLILLVTIGAFITYKR